MKRTKIKCEYCGREISKSNYSKHIRSHENGNFDKYKSKTIYHLDHDNLFCKFCNKEFKNKNSLVQHEIRCKHNPNKIKIKNNLQEDNNKIKNKEIRPWNKGLTKETDERIKNSIKTFHKNKQNGLHKPYNYKHTDEIKNKLSNYAKSKNHFWKYRKKNKIVYNGIKFDSSYEVLVAKDLDKNNILWQKPKSFKYIFNNKQHTYTPDFYLPDYNIYLDPKNDFLINNINPGTGYKDTDKIKTVEIQNNITILILDKNHLTWNKILKLINDCVNQ